MPEKVNDILKPGEPKKIDTESLAMMIFQEEVISLKCGGLMFDSFQGRNSL